MEECENCFTCENCYTDQSCVECQVCVECQSCYTAESCDKCESCFTCETVAQPHGLVQKTCQIKPKIYTNSLTIFASNGCNLDCEYCFFRGTKDKDNLTYEVGKEAVDFLFLVSDSTKPVSIWFFGGEPFLNYEVMQKVILYGKQKAKKYDRQLSFGATTNMTLLNQERIDFWHEEGGNLLISLDGCEEGHNFYRKDIYGEGSFATAWNWTEKWLKLKPETSIRFTVNPETLLYQIKGLKFLVEWGVNNIAMCPNQECDWSEEDYKLYKENLLEIAEVFIAKLREGRRLLIKPFEDGFSLHKIKGRMGGTRCGTGGYDVGVGVDGKLYRCHRFVLRGEAGEIGNVWDGFSEKRKETLNYDINKIQGYNCEKCMIKARCNGYCIAVNQDRKGDLWIVPEEVCKQEIIHQEVADFILNTLRSEEKLYNKVMGNENKSCR
ncbi:MAG: Anaerobic sulfatase-maturating enzyme [candidate division WS2 bacterium]|nr:Anaerobic sulfatase-maturating enzyme [Candidatus Lithacetigena glycinireducens]